jgi:SOS-response transcriptional repressor LexA
MLKDRHPIAARLKTARVAAGYKTAKQFADAHSIAQGTYALHESGGRGLQREAAVEYAKLLNVSVDWLYTGEGQGPSSVPPGVAEDRAAPFEAPPRMIQVKALDVRASAGGGSVVESERELGFFGFPPGEFTTPADRLRVITVVGDSMFKPGDPSSLQDGDRVVIDLDMIAPSPPGIFALYDGIGQVLKCVEPVSGKKNRVRVFSLNSNYSPYELSPTEAHIQGRVRAVWRRI